jgi:hypothetical protein
MSSANFRQAYLRAARERPAQGFTSARRPELTLDQARTELAQSISRIANEIFKDRYGPLVGAVTEPAINEFLRSFEANLDRAKGDITLVIEELLDRTLPPRSRRRR